MARKTDYIRQNPKDPRKFRFSVGSLTERRQVFIKEFDDILEATIWFEGWLKMARGKLGKIANITLRKI